jgi:hypothetical protein
VILSLKISLNGRKAKLRKRYLALTDALANMLAAMPEPLIQKRTATATSTSIHCTSAPKAMSASPKLPQA